MASNSDEPAPRAVIHKRILDVAAQRPDASVEALAAEVPGASPALVERVLEEYGDPAERASAEPAKGTSDDLANGASAEPAKGTSGEPAAKPSVSTAAGLASLPDLSDDQLATLRAIAETPTATQAELGERLGVSAATVNKRVNAIDGFDWADRRSFVAKLLGDPADASATEGEPPVGAAGEPPAAADEVAATTEGPSPTTKGPSPTAEGPSPTAEVASAVDEPSPTPEGPSPAAEEPVTATVDRPTAADEPITAGDEPASTHEPTKPAHGPVATENGGQLLPPDDPDAIEQLQERVARLEQRLASGMAAGEALFDDRELLVKVIRAVLVDDEITYEEGLQVLEALL